MKKNRFQFRILWALALELGLAIGHSEPGPKLGFTSGGYLFWENYRLWEADYGGTVYKGDWFNSILGGFVLENVMSEKLRTRVALESRFTRPFPEQEGQVASKMTHPDSYLHEAKAIYAFGNLMASPVQVEVGYFLYDYAQEQHNLGEYLFRSKIYPNNLFTDFELPMDRLLGIRLGHSPFKGFQHDLLITSEYKYYPKSDFSISYLPSYTVAGVLTLGAGVSFSHLIAVRPSLESPKKENNTYVQIPGQTISRKGITHVIPTTNGFLGSLLRDDSLSFLDSVTNERQLYPEIQKTINHYSYQGTKLMGRIAIDPKPLLGTPAWLGNEDLKLYSEFAVLGWKNYPLLYERRSQRIPVMAGFNFPCFKVLDVLGIEVEYFGNKFVNDWEKSVRDGLPQPGSTNGTFDGEPVYQDDWKWSLYTRKQISKGLFISAQAASDHLRLANKDGYTYESLMKDTGGLFSGQWWGIFRVTASY